jgi:choline-phosphate cytidylyltransferase
VNSSSSKTVITFGTFDVFHLGHLQILERSAALGDRLIVGVSTDKLNIEKKGRQTVYSERERMAIVRAIRYVDEVFPEESLALKATYLKTYSADVLAMGDDWKGKFDHLSGQCEVVYFPRTPAISTTELIEKIQIDY